MRTFVIGDIHGAHKALEQCLQRSAIDIKNDRLIVLGDVCDGWPYVYECVETLLTIENRIDIKGNHDEWFRQWFLTSRQVDMWSQGGKGTILSYAKHAGRDISLQEYTTSRPDANGRMREYKIYETGLLPSDIPATHWRYFQHMNLYYKDDERNAFFVHAGFDRWKSISENRSDRPSEFYWDRDLWNQAMSCKGEPKLQTVDDFDKIYIGHTSTTHWTENEIRTIDGIIIPRGAPITKPMYGGGVWNLDTGAGMRGKLTIMDVDTDVYWQSDLVSELYPEEAKNR